MLTMSLHESLLFPTTKFISKLETLCWEKNILPNNHNLRQQEQNCYETGDYVLRAGVEELSRTLRHKIRDEATFCCDFQ